MRKVVLEEDDGVEKKINSKPSVAEEAAAAAKAAAAAASDVAKASQEMLYSKNEGGFSHNFCPLILCLLWTDKLITRAFSIIFRQKEV